MWHTLRAIFWGEQAYQTYWYAFVLSLPFTWRKVLIPSVLGGPFNEYLDISLYIGDILMLSSLLLILKHVNTQKSILKLKKVFHVEHALLFSLLAYTLISVLWSSSYYLWADALIGIVRVFSVFTVFSYIIFNSKIHESCSTWNILRITALIFAFSLLLQGVIALCQFTHNGSIGLWSLGESVISSDSAGVAKVVIDGEKHIRSYGTLLHPNVLAGYGVVLLLILFGYQKYMFHVEQMSRSNRKYKKLFHVEHVIKYIALPCSCIILLLTFSKSAAIAFTLSIITLLFHVEHISKGWYRKFHVEHVYLAFSMAILIAVGVVHGAKGIEQSTFERVSTYRNTVEVLSEKAIFGSGLGQSVFHLAKFSNHILSWEIQPVHNIYLLLLFELGIIGFLILVIAAGRYFFRTVPRGTMFVTALPLVSILIIGLFDHYPITLFVGQSLLGMSLAWYWQGKSLFTSTIDK